MSISRRLSAAVLLSTTCLSVAAQDAAIQPFSALSQLNQLQDEEKRIWDEAADADKMLQRRGSLYGNAKVDGYLQSLLDELYPEFKGAVRIKTVNDPSLNAFAMPNGSIYINLGLVARLEDEAQLVTVLAHEGAHFIQRHGYQQRQSAKSASAFALGIGAVGGVVGILGQLVAVSSVYGFSREHEHEADRIGFERIVKQGYDTQQGAKVFEILREEAKLLELKEPFMFASHPKLDERVQSFQELRAQSPSIAALKRKEEQRFLENTREVRQAWVEQAFNLSLFKNLIYVLEQPGADQRYSAQSSYYLGEAYRMRNGTDDQAKAARAFEQAMQQAPDFAPTYRALGMLRLQSGEKDQARTLFSRYLLMAPSAVDAAFVRSYLE